MKRSLITAIFAVAAAGSVLAQGRPKATVVARVAAERVHAGSTVHVSLEVSLPEGVHVQSNKPRDPLLIPTTLTITPPAGVTVGDIVYPKATEFVQAGQTVPLAVFEQKFVVDVTLSVERSAPEGVIVVPARFRYQACDQSTCFAPLREETSWTLKVAPEVNFR